MVFQLDHQERYFVEELTFTDATSILTMLRGLCPHLVDGRLPVWIRNLSYRLVLMHRPDEPALMREAAVGSCTPPAGDRSHPCQSS